MNIKPMIFNTEMVQALLDGRKVQTRRPVKLDMIQSERAPLLVSDGGRYHFWCFGESDCPFGVPGDLIYVRETYSETDIRTAYLAGPDDGIHCIVKRWTPSIHMPRWASRLTLKVTGVRVERVQDISKADAEAEGFKLPPVDGQEFSIGAKTNFRHAWEKIYGDSWERNDWVWVIDFEVIRQNVDEYLKEQERAA